jgi:hypothetical protein
MMIRATQEARATWHGQPPQAARYRDSHTGDRMCKLCIAENDSLPRFGDDNPIDWYLDDQGEPEGRLYPLLPEGERGPCGWCGEGGE